MHMHQIKALRALGQIVTSDSVILVLGSYYQPPKKRN